MLLSVLNCQTAYARALIVDYKKLGDLQLAGDVLGAQQVMVDAFDTDVRPLLMQVRSEKGIDVEPLAAYRADGYVKKVAKERGLTISAGSALQ